MHLAEQIGWPLVVVGAALFLQRYLGDLVAVGLVAIGGVLIGSAIARRN